LKPRFINLHPFKPYPIGRIKTTNPTSRTLSCSPIRKDHSDLDSITDLVLPYARQAWEGQALWLDLYTASLLLENLDLVGPQLNRCLHVESELERSLVNDASFSQKYDVQYINNVIKLQDKEGKAAHAFLIITQKETGKKYILDAQYQQFVDVNYRDGLPGIMIFEISKNGNIIDELKKFRISTTNLKWWTESMPIKITKGREVNNAMSFPGLTRESRWK